MPTPSLAVTATEIKDFEHSESKHRPATAARIVAHEATDHPTEGQLVALARKFFLKHDRMSDTPTPS